MDIGDEVELDDLYNVCDKKRLIQKWSARTGVPQTELRRLFEALIDVIFDELANGNSIVIRGLFTIRPIGWLQKVSGKLKSNPSFVKRILHKLEISAMDRLKIAMEKRGKVPIKVPGVKPEDRYSWDDDENGSLEIYLAAEEMREYERNKKSSRRAPGQGS